MNEYMLTEYEYDKILENYPKEIKNAKILGMVLSVVFGATFAFAGIMMLIEGLLWGIAFFAVAAIVPLTMFAMVKNTEKQMALFQSGNVKTYIATVTGKHKHRSSGKNSTTTYYLCFESLGEKGINANRRSCGSSEYRAAEIGDEVIFINFLGEKSMSNKMIIRKLLY